MKKKYIKPFATPIHVDIVLTTGTNASNPNNVFIIGGYIDMNDGEDPFGGRAKENTGSCWDEY